MGQGQVGCRIQLLGSEMVAQVLQQLLSHSLFPLLQHSSSCASWQTAKQQKQHPNSNDSSLYKAHEYQLLNKDAHRAQG